MCVDVRIRTCASPALIVQYYYYYRQDRVYADCECALRASRLFHWIRSSALNMLPFRRTWGFGHPTIDAPGFSEGLNPG